MKTQTEGESEPRKSNQNHHGPFYRSAELVAGVHRAEGGIFAGFRAAHALGCIYAGTFTATPVAKTLSRAAHFQGTPISVTARLSGASGDPKKPPLNIVAMATKFYLPNGTVTDLIAITLPAFFARTPEEFLEFTEAKTPASVTMEDMRHMCLSPKRGFSCRSATSTQLRPRRLRMPA